MNYKINEIFHSIQGEGRYTGYPMIFIRFSGCNLKCDFCDTDFHNYKLYSITDIKEKIYKYDCNRICFTGGEPTLQLNRELIDELKHLGYILHIETNGTRDIPDGIDWITISPKENWKIKKGDELKVVYYGQDLDQFDNVDFKYKYLQPMDGKGNFLPSTIDKCKKSDWLLSIQTQKIMNIR